MTTTIEREKCIHVQVDVDIFDHPKAFKAKPDGLAVYLAALGYCRKHQTDGRMPRGAAMGLLGGAGARVLDRLVSIGWIIEVSEDEIEVWNYAKKNQTKAEIEEAKRRARDRMRAHREEARALAVRANKGRTNDEQAPNEQRSFAVCSSSSSSSLSEGEMQGGGGSAEPAPAAPPEPVSSARLRLAPDPLGDHGLGAAWADGIRDGSGTAITVPRGGELRKLVDVVDTHGPPRGEPESLARREAWLRERGAAYGAAARDGGRSVFKFADWANNGGRLAGPAARAEEPAARPYHAIAKGYQAPPPKLGDAELAAIAETRKALGIA